MGSKYSVPTRCRNSSPLRGSRVRSSSWLPTLKRWRPRRMMAPSPSYSSVRSCSARNAWSRRFLTRPSMSSALTGSCSCSRRRWASSLSLPISGSPAKKACSASALASFSVRLGRLCTMRRAASSTPCALRWRSSCSDWRRASKLSSTSSRLAMMSPRNCSCSPKRLSISSSCTSRRASCSSHFSGVCARPRALTMLCENSASWAANWATFSAPPRPDLRCSARARTWFRRA